MFFYAENHRGLTSEEHTRFLSRVNAMRDLQNEHLIDLVTLRDALSIWTLCITEITQSKTIHGFIDGFYTEKHRQPTAEEWLPLVNDVRIKSGHNLIALKSIRVAISTWERVHPEIEKEKSVHDCIDGTYAERGRLPTTDELHSRMNEVRRERNEKSCSQSSLLRSSLRWRNKPRRWPRQLRFVDILYVLFHGVRRPLKYAIEDVAGGGGERLGF